MNISHAQLEVRVEKWRSLILPEWTVVLYRKPPGDDDDEDYSQYRGTCQPNENLRSMKVWLNVEDIDDVRDLDETIVHELLHGPLGLVQQPLNDVSFQLGEATASQVRHRQRLHAEHLVEGVARALVAIEHGKDRERTYWEPSGL